MKWMSIVNRFATLFLLTLVAGCALEQSRQSSRPVLVHAEPPAWIWSQSPGGDGPGSERSVTFRRIFRAEETVSHASLVATCDNELVLELDGEVVATSRTWETPIACDVTRLFANGSSVHELIARCRNAGGPAGLIVELTLTGTDGRARRLVTDSDWRWKDGDRWHSVVVLGELGDGPWFAVDESAFSSAAMRRTPTATSADHIVAPPGYLVELLCAPGPDDGSWVSLCVDPQGRFYTSDERSAGLRRLTPVAGGALSERLDVDFSGAQGLLWKDGALYAIRGDLGDKPGGLFRLTDTDGDDALDHVELLRTLHGSGGEHGWHALVPSPDGMGLLAIGGNQTTLTDLSASRVPPHWGEDQLLPRLPDAGGFMTGTLAPGGCIYRVDLDGQHWELLSMGYRNPYDLAVHPGGDIFTVDADMEWDLNTPWYRPTRVCLVSSGSDYGWRNGSGKFPPTYLDTLPPVLDLGPGSPVGMTFGHETDFPARHREALFVGDWSYGRVYAVHLQADGAAWRGSAELFLSGTPLPVTDLVVNPLDGALYFVTGGRDVRGGFYRVRYVGGAQEESRLAATNATSGPPSADRGLRARLESLHGAASPDALDSLWAQLGHEDRFVRSAARVALEWQPIDGWRERALAESDPRLALTALAALVRSSGRDVPHRAPGHTPDPELKTAVFEALSRWDWERLEETLRLDLLRVTSLALMRLGSPDDGSLDAFRADWSARFPDGSPRVDSALCELLAFLQDPALARRAVEQLLSAPTQEAQLDFARSLRWLEAGWTPELRAEYAGWFARAAAFRGGASLAGYVRSIRNDAMAGLSLDERAAFEERASASGPEGLRLGATSLPPTGKARRTAHAWTSEELLPGLKQAFAKGAVARDQSRGRMLFGAVGCFACHRVSGEGGAVGPDLTGVAGRFGLRDLLDAILDPSATISDQYRRSTIRMADGEVLSGQVVNLSGDWVDVSTDLFRPGDLVSMDRGLIESITPSEVSAMPEGLLDLLEEDEVADLLAYLLTANQL